MTFLSCGMQGPDDHLVHSTAYFGAYYRALDETVDAQLVVQHPAGALAGRDAGEDQHGDPDVPNQGTAFAAPRPDTPRRRALRCSLYCRTLQADTMP